MYVTSTVGYNFSKSFGLEVGIPVYFLNPSSSLAGGTRTSGLSNVFVVARMTLENPLLKSISTLTGTAPSGDTSKGLSTGRATFEWSNRFEHEFDRFTPFIDLGVGNSVADYRNFRRPYISLGKVAHFEGGSDFGLGPLTLTLAGFADVPWGQQKVYSRLVPRAPSSGGLTATGLSAGTLGGFGNANASAPGSQTKASKTFRPGATRTGTPRKGGFEADSQTVGGPDLTRDNGAIASLSATVKGVDLDLGYTYSAPFHLNTVSFGIGFDLSPVIRRVRRR